MINISMKYLNWYNKLIQKSKTQNLNENRYTEKHHIVPRHCGGKDAISNIAVLTFRQHILAHLLLWKIYNKTEDEAAYKFMKGISSDEKKQILAVLGGRVQGKINTESGHIQRIQKMVDWSANGKRSAEICRKRKVNAFFDPVLRTKIASKGGKVQGKINAESGHMARIAKLPRKKNMSTMIWITNNNKTKWHDKDEPIPTGWRRGRTLRKHKKTKI